MTACEAFIWSRNLETMAFGAVFCCVMACEGQAAGPVAGRAEPGVSATRTTLSPARPSAFAVGYGSG